MNLILSASLNFNSHDFLCSAVSHLSIDFYQKIMRYKRWQDQQASMIGRMLLLHGFLRSGIPILLDDIQYTDYNRPFVPYLPDFNISHSGDYVICAIHGDGKVGIDIEQHKKIVLEDFESVLNDEEIQLIKESTHPMEHFFRIWASKEAIVKANGHGLSYSLKKINTLQNVISLDNVDWNVYPLPAAEGYAAALATTSSLDAFDIINLDSTDIEDTIHHLLDAKTMSELTKRYRRHDRR